MGRFLVVFITLAALVSPAGRADVLVTQGGERIKTRGPWEVKGRQVIFTSSDGVLSSIRLSEVDLEASEEATRKALEPPAPPPPPPAEVERREPVLVLTDETLATGGNAEGYQTVSAFGGDVSFLVPVDLEEVPASRLPLRLAGNRPVVTFINPEQTIFVGLFSRALPGGVPPGTLELMESFTSSVFREVPGVAVHSSRVETIGGREAFVLDFEATAGEGARVLMAATPYRSQMVVLTFGFQSSEGSGWISEGDRVIRSLTVVEPPPPSEPFEADQP